MNANLFGINDMALTTLSTTKFLQSVPSTSANFILSTRVSCSSTSIIIKAEKNLAFAALEVKNFLNLYKKENKELETNCEKAFSMSQKGIETMIKIERPTSPLDIVKNDHNYETNNLKRNWFVSKNKDQASRCREISNSNDYLQISKVKRRKTQISSILQSNNKVIPQNSNLSIFKDLKTVS